MWLQDKDRLKPPFPLENRAAEGLKATGLFIEVASPNEKPKGPKPKPSVSWSVREMRIADGQLVPPELISNCSECLNRNIATGPTAEKTLVFRHYIACSAFPETVAPPDEIKKLYRKERSAYEEETRVYRERAKAKAARNERLEKIQREAPTRVRFAQV